MPRMTGPVDSLYRPNSPGVYARASRLRDTQPPRPERGTPLKRRNHQIFKELRCASADASSANGLRQAKGVSANPLRHYATRRACVIS